MASDTIGYLPTDEVDGDFERVLFLEGAFDVNFFRALLKANGRSRIRIERLAGVTGFRSKILVRSQEPRFRSVRWLGVAIDGDTNPHGRYVSVRDAVRLIKSVKFTIPEAAWVASTPGPSEQKLVIFVFPDGRNSGDIETYLRNAVQDQPASTCVDQYLECLGRVGITPRSASKAWLYAFLASLAEAGETLSAAARAGQLALSLPGFQPLLDLIPADDEEV
jgi:hypothetical protein